MYKQLVVIVNHVANHTLGSKQINNMSHVYNNAGQVCVLPTHGQHIAQTNIIQSKKKYL